MTSPVLPHSILSDSARPRTCLSCQKSFVYSSMDWHCLNVLLPLRAEVYRNLLPIPQLCILPPLHTHAWSISCPQLCPSSWQAAYSQAAPKLPLSISQCQVPSQEFMLCASTNTIILDGFALQTADNNL